MIMKAVVLQTQGHEAAILVNDGTVRIAHGRFAVGDIIDYKSVVRRSLLRWAAAAAAMVMLTGISAGLWIDRNYVTYAEVSLDVNPSIVYSINKRDRVLGVRAANGDAQSIVAQLQGVRFSPLSEAVEKTMALLEDEGYLDADTDDYVLVNVSADDDTRQTRLTAEVETAMATTLEHNPTMEYRIDHSDRETAKEAADTGMSPGRYSAWQKEDDQTHLEDYADKPVRELMEHDPKDADHSHGEDAGGREDADRRETPAPSSDTPREEEPPSEEKEPSGEDQAAEPDSAPGGEEKPESDASDDSEPQSDENRPSEQEPPQQAPSDHQPDQSPGESPSRQSEDKAEKGKSAGQKSPPRESKGDGHRDPHDGGK